MGHTPAARRTDWQASLGTYFRRGSEAGRKSGKGEEKSDKKSHGDRVRPLVRHRAAETITDTISSRRYAGSAMCMAEPRRVGGGLDGVSDSGCSKGMLVAKGSPAAVLPSRRSKHRWVILQQDHTEQREGDGGGGGNVGSLLLGVIDQATVGCTTGVVGLLVVGLSKTGKSKTGKSKTGKSSAQPPQHTGWSATMAGEEEQPRR